MWFGLCAHRKVIMAYIANVNEDLPMCQILFYEH